MSLASQYVGAFMLTFCIPPRVVLKFTLLHITRRPLMFPPIPERDIDPENLPPSTHSSPTLVPSSLGSSPPGTPEHLRNNHESLPPHPLLTAPPHTNKTSMVEDFILSKALTTSSVKNPASLVKPLLAPREWISEAIYILRPLIYGQSPCFVVSLELIDSLQCFSSRLIESVNQEGLSWFLSLSRSYRAICVAHLQTPLLSSVRSTLAGTAIFFGISSAALFGRVGRGMIFNLSPHDAMILRFAFCSPKIESLAESSARWPILNIFGPFLRDWMPLVDEYYYCELRPLSPLYLTYPLVQIHPCRPGLVL